MNGIGLIDYYGENCKKILSKYLETNIGSCDVSLIGSDGVLINSYAMILSACSVYLNNVLKNVVINDKNLVILLPSYSSKEIQVILDFIYYGSIPNIDQVSIISLKKHNETNVINTSIEPSGKS